MATRPLQTIKLKNEDGEDTTYTLSGTYPDLIAGAAEQITTNIHESDSTPYVFRPTPYNSTRESGYIVGASVAWNQEAYAFSSTAWKANNSSASFADGVATFTATARYGGVTPSINAYRPTVVAGHKYFFSVQVKKYSTSAAIVASVNYGSNQKYYSAESVSSTDWITLTAIDECVSGTLGQFSIQDNGTSGWGSVNVRNIMFVDLTLALGSTIADYIYTLESGTAGAGIAKLREWGFFTKPYYAYNTGGIESVNVSKHKMVGLNQWDEEWEVGAINTTTGANQSANNTIRAKNMMPCVPNTEYYLGTDIGAVYWYDINDAFIKFDYNNATGNLRTSPSNAYRFRFVMKSAYGTTYNHDICVNISNAAVNGTYEPYTVNEYPLDSSLTLRGILKLDGNNNLYADGDVYEADGTVTRKFVQVTLNGSEDGWASSGRTTEYNYFKINVGAKGTAVDHSCFADKLSQVTITVSTTEIGVDYINSNGYNAACIFIRTADAYLDDIDVFKTWLAANPVTVIYEVATPTTESASPFQTPQVCSPYGTEEFVDAGVAAGTRDVSIPVGHNTEYMKNIVGAIEGIPLPPSANGTYTLKVTVASGVPTYSWVSE